MSSEVISDQTLVSCRKYISVSSTGCKFAKTQLPIKFFRETFQVHIRRVHVAVKLGPRFTVHVARGDGDGFNAEGAAGVRHVHGVFGENHRVVVGEGDGLAAVAQSGFGDYIRRGRVGQPSTSRALLMSQFWQKRQPRLQPAVPNDSTLVPG